MGRFRLTVVAAAATLLATCPLSTVLAGWSWLVSCALAVLAVAGATTVARVLRARTSVQVAAAAAVLLELLTLRHGAGALVPTPAVLRHFATLLQEAAVGVRDLAIPVGDHRGLLFLTTLGVGLVAIWVDIHAAALRQPAVAGLPMLVFYTVAVSVRTDSVPVLPFVAGAFGFLWLLGVDQADRIRRFGRRFTAGGGDVDVWAPTRLAPVGRRLAIVGVLLAVAVPIAMPGLDHGLLDGRLRGGDRGRPDGDNTGRVDLVALLEGQLSSRTEVSLLRLTTDGLTPRLLRLAVADQLAVDGFHSRDPSGAPVGPGRADPRQDARPGARYVAGRATVDISGLDVPLLPVFPEVVRLDGVDGTWRYDPETGVLFSPRSRTPGLRYRFDFVHIEHSAQALRTAPPLAESDPLRRRFASVPAVPGIGERVASWTAGAGTPYDVVQALLDRLSTARGFRYTRETGPVDGGAAIIAFLDNKVGYCVQYAAALAWLVRAAGIPARVAFGLLTGGTGGTGTLTNQNLHAWTEVYFAGFGWVPFDATPAAADGGPAPPRASAAPTRSPERSPGPGRTAEPEPPPAIGGPTPPSRSRWPAYALAGLFLAGLLLTLPAQGRSLLRRRRAIRAGDAHAAWAEFLDTLVDLKLTVDPAHTPRRIMAGATRGLAPPAQARASELASAEEQARYARRPPPPGNLDATVRVVRRALIRGASRRRRLAAVLLPRSVLLRWRLALTRQR